VLRLDGFRECSNRNTIKFKYLGRQENLLSPSRNYRNTGMTYSNRITIKFKSKNSSLTTLSLIKSISSISREIIVHLIPHHSTMPSDSSAKSLIVDFPAAAHPDANSTTVRKSVRFSSHCDGKFIPYPSDKESEVRWYSERHQKLFKRKMTRDAMKCSEVLGLSITRPMNTQKWESIKAMRKHHVNVVLQEQERMRRCREFKIVPRNLLMWQKRVLPRIERGQP
jgi:hypothetical protein